MDKKYIIKEHMIHSGQTAQVIYRFPNGYGASVVCGPYSYGGTEGLFELGVVTFDKEDRHHLCYTTPITSDVEGYLTPNKVKLILEEIYKLPKIKE